MLLQCSPSDAWIRNYANPLTQGPGFQDLLATIDAELYPAPIAWRYLKDSTIKLYEK